MFDISTLGADETAAIHLKDAQGAHLHGADDKPCRIILYGPASKKFQAVADRQTARAVRRMQENDNKVTVAPPEQRRKEEAEDLAELTVGFENFTYAPAGAAQGSELFTALYLDPKLGFITRQVAKAVGEWGNFTNGSAAA